MIKVLIVDDSKVVQEFMKYLLSTDPAIQVIGVAGSGEEAVEFVAKNRPDVITMDIHMPIMDGYEATREIMHTVPTPIVIVSGSLRQTEVSNSFRLIEAGALAVVLRPPGMGDPKYAMARKELISTIKLMSEVKVVRRFQNQMQLRKKIVISESSLVDDNLDIKLIAIGASTGGPVALNIILMNLPKNLPVPVVIVQHIAKGFLNGFRDWLSAASSLPVNIAKNGEFLQPGNVYLAPDDLQMGISPGLKIKLEKAPPENGLIPAVDYLFRSVAQVLGPNAIGVLLSGMGKDGAKELKGMKDKGSITLVQNEETCVVFGMPGEAVALGAADQILSPDKIAETIVALCNKQ